jgi:hypothetical protein
MRTALIVILGLLSFYGQAHAVPLPKVQTAPSALKEPAAVRSHTWKYTGPRMPYRYGPFAYYYDGWWYPRPWWYGPGLVFKWGSCGSCGVFEGTWHDLDWAEGGYTEGTDAHVEWCIEHYRSYDNGSDTYLGRDGARHPCRTPFD